MVNNKLMINSIINHGCTLSTSIEYQNVFLINVLIYILVGTFFLCKSSSIYIYIARNIIPGGMETPQRYATDVRSCVLLKKK